MKKWLIAEAMFLTLVPAGLAIYAIPVLVFGAVEAFAPTAADTRSFSIRLFELAPYAGGIFGIYVIWSLVARIASGASFPFKLRFALGTLGGALATWEIARTTNAITVILVCLPTWLLVIHLLILNRASKRDDHQELLDR